LAQHAPLLGAARLALPRAEDTHVRRVVNRGLHAQDRALLVIHLDGIAIEPMLDADAFRPLSQVRGDLALKATVNPALSRHPAAQKTHHLTAAQMLHSVLD